MYSLCAILGRTQDLELEPLIYASARTVRLHAGISMIPLGEQLLAEIQSRSRPEPLDERLAGVFEFLTKGVEQWLRVLSESTSTVYVETEYFAGEGFERAAVWTVSQLALGPLDGAGSINQALRSLGVLAPADRPEFEVIGLDRCRTIEEWLATLDVH